MNFVSSCYFCFVVSNITLVQSARILGVSSYPAISHQSSLLPIWKELSLRGHQVIALVTHPLKDKTLVNLTEIDVSHTLEIVKKSEVQIGASNDWMFSKLMFIWTLFEEIVEDIFNNKDVEILVDTRTQKFDLILVEFLHPLAFAFAARFKAPIIGISSLSLFLSVHDAVGNPTHPAIYPDVNFEVDPKANDLTFMERLGSLFYNIGYRVVYYWYILPRSDSIARKYFGNDMPYLGDLVQNVSLVLANVNPVMHTVRPSVPNVVEVGQLHIKKEKEALPEDIQKYLNASRKGVIYFSLGTTVITSKLSKDIIRIITEALSELPYDVLMKWEKDKLPVPKPSNVMLKKWLPQQDLLHHPKIKVFVTQGGIQSIEEAIFGEVPMVGIPFIGDQPHNVKRLIQSGIGQGIGVNELSKDALKKVISEVAENKTYKENVKKVKQILNDQPIKGLEKAVWWIEYVLRHKGAPHLRSPTANMTFFEYFMIDVVIFLGFVVIVLVYAINKIVAWVLRKIRVTKKKNE